MNNAALVLELMLLLARRQQEFALLLQKSQSEGRDVTKEELDTLVASDDASRKALDDLIASKKAEGK